MPTDSATTGPPEPIRFNALPGAIRAKDDDEKMTKRTQARGIRARFLEMMREAHAADRPVWFSGFWHTATCARRVLEVRSGDTMLTIPTGHPKAGGPSYMDHPKASALWQFESGAFMVQDEGAEPGWELIYGPTRESVESAASAWWQANPPKSLRGVGR